MSKIKIFNTSAYSSAMIIRRYIMPATGAYETVNSTPSGIYYTSAHVIEYGSYLFLIYVFFTLKYIIGKIIFVSNSSNKRIRRTV